MTPFSDEFIVWSFAKILLPCFKDRSGVGASCGSGLPWPLVCHPQPSLEVLLTSTKVLPPSKVLYPPSCMLPRCTTAAKSLLFMAKYLVYLSFLTKDLHQQNNWTPVFFLHQDRAKTVAPQLSRFHLHMPWSATYDNKREYLDAERSQQNMGNSSRMSDWDRRLPRHVPQKQTGTNKSGTNKIFFSCVLKISKCVCNLYYSTNVNQILISSYEHKRRLFGINNIEFWSIHLLNFPSCMEKKVIGPAVILLSRNFWLCHCVIIRSAPQVLRRSFWNVCDWDNWLITLGLAFNSAQKLLVGLHARKGIEIVPTLWQKKRVCLWCNRRKVHLVPVWGTRMEFHYSGPETGITAQLASRNSSIFNQHVCLNCFEYAKQLSSGIAGA